MPAGYRRAAAAVGVDAEVIAVIQFDLRIPGCSARRSAAHRRQRVHAVSDSSVRSEAHKDYKGRRFYFCAETCRRAFEQDPERYASRAA